MLALFEEALKWELHPRQNVHNLMPGIVNFASYFRHAENQFGLSCYQRISVENEDERGARMKSVGIICSKYTSLHEHMEFLEDQVR